MEDMEFLQSFENQQIPKQEFDHEALLRVSWLYLNTYEFDTASAEIVYRLKNYAQSLEDDNFYHDTLVRFWIYMVYRAIEVNPYGEIFSDFLTHNEHLMDQSLPLDYYQEETLLSKSARHKWEIPDIKPFIDI
ncbi:MAG: hypothetical protein KIT27_05300 [Legionellales bacterium]|nr:hypothetical protein [Legionellales bacterium]